MCFNKIMETKYEKDKQINPPYGSNKKLREALRLLSTRSFSKLTLDDLTSRGFTKTDAFQTLAGFRFLGLINEDGTTNDLSRLHSIGDKRTEYLAEILKKSYSDIFKTASEANKLPREELFNEFLAVYKLTRRLATTAVPNFLWLCKEAGLEVAEELVTREHRKQDRNKREARLPKETLKPQKENIVPTSTASETNQFLTLDTGVFKLSIPNKPEIVQALGDGEFKKILEGIKEAIEEISHRSKTNGGEAGGGK